MIGERIRKRRKTLNITATRLGEMIGVSQAAVTAYESGTRKPNIEYLHKLADALETSADYLIGRTNDSSPKGRDDEIAEIIKNNDFHYNGEKLSEEDLQLFIKILERFVEKKENDNKSLIK